MLLTSPDFRRLADQNVLSGLAAIGVPRASVCAHPGDSEDRICPVTHWLAIGRGLQFFRDRSPRQVAGHEHLYGKRAPFNRPLGAEIAVVTCVGESPGHAKRVGKMEPRG